MMRGFRVALVCALMFTGCFQRGGIFQRVSLSQSELVAFEASSTTQNSAVISWSMQASGNLSVSYHLDYSTSSSLSSATTVQDILPPYTLSNLQPSTTYYFRISQVGTQGVLAVSKILSFTTLGLLPGVPTFGALTGGSTSITVNFTSGAGATSHSLFYSTNSNLTGAAAVTISTSPYVLTGLTTGTLYYLKIRATNTSGFTDSVPSSALTTVQAPGVPVVSSVTPQQTSASFVFSAGAGGTPTSYWLQWATNSGLAGATALTNVTSPVAISGLTPGTIYYYKLTAQNSGGATATAVANFTTLLPAAGAPLISPASAITTTSATLNWLPPTSGVPISYRVRYGLTSSFTPSTTINSAVSPRVLNALTPGTTYYFEVGAVYTGGQITTASSSFQTVALPPGVPLVGTVTPGQTTAVINWSAGPGGPVASYNFLYGTSSTLVGAQTISNAVSPLTLTGLVSGQIYYFKITALSNGLGSASSAITSFTTTTSAPTAPVIGGITSVTSSGATISWSGGTGATSFDIKYGTSSTLVGAAIVTATTPPKLLTGLNSSTTYYVQVIAKNGSGSTPSAILSFMTLMQAPTAPVLGTVTSITQTEASVPWSAGASTSQTNFQTTLYPVMRNRCLVCHETPNQNGTSPHAATAVSLAHMAMFYVDNFAQQKVNISNSNSSRLFTKLVEGHQCGASCSGEVLTAINSWIAGGAGSGGITASFTLKYGTSSTLSGAQTVSNAISPVVLSGLTAGTTYYYQVTASNSAGSTLSAIQSFSTLNSSGGSVPLINFEAQLRVGDRRYVDDILRTIFGVPSTTTGVGLKIQQNIWERVDFGGACDRYAGVNLTSTTLENPSERCQNGMGAINPSQVNPIRMAWIAKTCDALIEDTVARGNAFTKIFGSTTAGVVNDVNLLKAFQLFYLEDTLSPEVKTSLIALGNSAGATTDTDRWKNILLGICGSTEWQIPY